jgi:two-component sensor histidine kinase
MLQEIHHRVKNNLQVVNSLLRMQSKKIEDKSIISVFKETQNRIRSMAQLHEKMYQSGGLDTFNTKEHITLLVEEIVKNYTVGKHIKLDLDIEEVLVSSKTMMPLSLIINEMISNSLKYAFEGRDEGIIAVKFSKTNENCELIVSDDGIGYTPDPKSEGLGLRLISSFTRQLNGAIEKTNDSGTTFKLTFKSIHKNPKKT